MSNPYIISGEASETDSEPEETSSKNDAVNIIQGSIVTGEDSESENDEATGSVASAVSALHLIDENLKKDIEEEIDRESLFQQKLQESNAAFCTNLETFVQATINDAGKTLNNVENHLLKSQIVLQEAVGSLKSLSVNSLHLKSKLHSILSAKFLSSVVVSSKPEDGADGLNNK